MRDADFSTTNAIAGAVNNEFGAGTAVAVDGGQWPLELQINKVLAWLL